MEPLSYYWHKLLRFRWYHITNRIKWWRQRRRRGFDDTELWGLDYTIAKFILPRLKRFREINNGCPGYLCDEFGMELGTVKWNKILDQMIFAFQYVVDEEDNWQEFRKRPNDDFNKYEKGIKLFTQYFRALWD